MKYFLLLLLSLYGCLCTAQKNNTEIEYAQLCIKFSPLSLIEPDQSISLATEFRPTAHIGIQLEGSYIFNTLYLNPNRYVSHTKGFRVVPEIRYYDIHFKKNVQRYIGLQLSYKKVQKEVEEWVRKNNYQQLIVIPIEKSNFTTTFLGGLQNNNHRIGYDFNIGLGFKYKILKGTNATGSMDFVNNYYGETLNGYYVQLSATFKLVMKL